MRVYDYNCELYHHGIKGMKWGVRRFRKTDGSLTPAGKKRYSDAIQKAKTEKKLANKEYNKAYNKYQLAPTNKNYQNVLETSKKLRTANVAYKKSKLDYRVAKKEAEGSFDSTKHKSKHRLALEKKYQEQGYDKKQAILMASDRIRTERILTASTALTVTACAAYAANKRVKDRTDQMIKSGDVLQRISPTNKTGKLHDVFYASKGEHDNKRYEGVLGLTRKMENGQAYMMKLEAQGDIKVASKDNAAKAFGDLYKNNFAFRESVKDNVSSHFNGKNKVDINNLSDKNIHKMYENFNSNLPFIRESGSEADKVFYNKLKSAGYGAIQDINDMKFSGYNARNPLIVFDNSKNNIMVKSVTEMTDKGKMYKKGLIEVGKGTVERMGENILSSPYTSVAVGGTAATMYVSDYSKNNKNR